MENKVMRVVLVQPGKKAEIRMIDGSLAGMQSIVGGHIQAVFFEDAVFVCNEEGKLRDLPFCRTLTDERNRVYDVVAGTFFICGVGVEDFESLDDKTAEKYLEKFLFPETLMKVNGHFIAKRYTP